jgi:hypothetical protein
MPKKSEYRESQQGDPQSAILICDPRFNVTNGQYSDLDVTASPILCLDRATEEHPGFVVIRFTDDLISERRTLVELCAALKRNSHSRDSRILALLQTKHRLLLEELKQAGVDYVWIEEDSGLEYPNLHGLINHLGEKDSPKRLLSPLCPYLHFARVAEHHEMTVCGAYLDRLVLAGKRLHELCETEGYHECEYFQKPRQQSGRS